MALNAERILDEAQPKKKADERRRTSDNVLEDVYGLLMMSYEKKKKTG